MLKTFRQGEQLLHISEPLRSIRICGDHGQVFGIFYGETQEVCDRVMVASFDKLAQQLDDTARRSRQVQQRNLTNWVLAQRALIHWSQLLEIIATGGRMRPTYGKGDSAGGPGALVDQAA